ncbi:MAG: uracil-DNA glycosylase [Lachnospirales bacterium]
MFKTNNDWDLLLEEECKLEYFKNLWSFVEDEYKNKVIYPPKELIFNALEKTSFKDTNVVILGQDPYIRENQAMGLSFSVPKGEKVPPSLKNVFKEMQNDLNIDFDINKSGDLSNWAKEGVLLLNSTLTVEEGKSGSHKNKGWEKFTDEIVRLLSEKDTPIVFMLWGNYAKEKGKIISKNSDIKHLILEASHPSPLARGAYFGSKHFSKANNFLKDNDLEPINWEI